MATIKIKTRIQAVYYQTPENTLGIKHLTSDKRITLSEAKEFLIENGIEYDTLLKVMYEDIDLEIPMKEYESYIVE